MDGIEFYMPHCFRDVEQLLAAESAEQASWPREPVTAFRALTGDPRNESPDTTGGDGGGDGGDGGAGTETGGDGGDGGAGAGGQGDGGDGGAGGSVQTPDFAAMFDDFRSDITSRLDDAFTPDPPPPAAPPERDFFDPREFSDEDFDDDGNLSRTAQQRALKEMMQQTVAEALAPQREQAVIDRRTREADALEAKYPDLQDDAKREAIINQSQSFAKFMAQATGNPDAERMWMEPHFIELVMLAQVGKTATAGQKAAGQEKGVVLEQGGSAGPSGGQGGGETAETAKRIVGLAQSSKFRLGS